MLIEGGDDIDQFMVKSHGISAFTDDKTGTVRQENLSWLARKLVFDHLRHKLACTATEASNMLKFFKTRNLRNDTI